MATTIINTYVTGIETSKSNIRTALNTKGCNISTSDALSTYNSYINSMPTIYTSTTVPTSTDGKNGDI
jgi:hypothetical protein